MAIEMAVLSIYLVCINLVAFVVYGIDKRRAVKRQWRISERTLLALAAAGGSVGALAGMYGFRHKTKHKKFVIGVPAILIAQIGIAWFCWTR